MTLTVPCSVSCLSFNPETSFTIWRNNCVASCKFPGKTTNLKLFPQRIMSRPSASDLSFPHYKCGSYLSHNARLHILSASGIDVAGEEVDRPLADEEATGSPGTQADQTNKVSSLGLNAPPVVPRRPRPTRKSDMPAVNTEELIPGATFTGKVRSVHPFGAFVDIGAFTNGLVHISRLSDKFVKDVGNIVSVGQEVKVRVVEANSETGRISLTMRENGVTGKLQQQKEAPISAADSPKPARRSHEDLSQKKAEVNKISKFVKGHKLKGTVKKLTRAGAFISLPEEEDGFLPTSEEAGEGLGSTMEGSSLRVGQEVDVCVLRVSRGQVTLTMKKDENSEELGNEIRASIVHTATNPFVLAFRENKELAAFLEERKRTEKTEISLTPVELVQDQPPQSNIGSAITSSSGEEIENEEEISIKGGDDRVSFI